MQTQSPIPMMELMERSRAMVRRSMEQTGFVRGVARRQLDRLIPALTQKPADAPKLDALMRPWPTLMQDFADFAVDSVQRQVLYWDIMRRAGNTFVEHEAAGCPPVLVFDYDMVVDGMALPRPVNYALVRIRVPEGAPPTDPTLRPFVIIDPRAGHGAGIGGFKSDSQVGVALQGGHAVFFVIFFREPAPGQTILDVTAAEGAFLRAVNEQFPDAPKPVVIGNCQGGWAAMMLSTAQPELTGPVVLNGAPLSYWAGETGSNPMRYSGGLVGGAWPALMMADLGNGRFDGAALVMNFEGMSPGNTWFRKYFDLYSRADTEAERFLEFERWWGGFFLMNREEISWIVNNLFIGNQFSQGELATGSGGTFDMKAIRSPVVVFASAGDNITPPGQALRWIADVYRDEREIRERGQTIIYLLHDDIGHLGIFVSGKIAKKEHTEIANTLEMIEAVAPGLYEMSITDRPAGDPQGRYRVELVERTLAEVRALCGDTSDAKPFPVVEKLSNMNVDLYDMTLGPLVRATATEASAEMRRNMHPLRVRRWAVSDKNPAMASVATLAETVRANRKPADPANPFLAMEARWAASVERSMNMMRDWNDAMKEVAFHGLYGSLAAMGVAAAETAPPLPAAEPSVQDPALREAMSHMRDGGYAAAVIRMMVLLANARGGVRRSRLARSDAMMKTEQPFAAMTASARQAMVREQSLLVSVAPEEALASLPALLPDLADRRRAMAAVELVAGAEADLGDQAVAMLHAIRGVLELNLLTNEA